MMLEHADRTLIAALSRGLPLVPRPFAAVADALGWSEAEVIERLRALMARDVVSRFGIVVRHRELGYLANAMVVWDVNDAEVDEAARKMAAFPSVTLCYRRPRRLPDWPYNVFCMIHGRDRGTVEGLIETLAEAAGLGHVPRATLFSRRRFKQCGARYAYAKASPPAPAVAAQPQLAEGLA